MCNVVQVLKLYNKCALSNWLRQARHVSQILKHRRKASQLPVGQQNTTDDDKNDDNSSCGYTSDASLYGEIASITSCSSGSSYSDASSSTGLGHDDEDSISTLVCASEECHAAKGVDADVTAHADAAVAVAVAVGSQGSHHGEDDKKEHHQQQQKPACCFVAFGALQQGIAGQGCSPDAGAAIAKERSADESASSTCEQGLDGVQVLPGDHPDCERVYKQQTSFKHHICSLVTHAAAACGKAQGQDLTNSSSTCVHNPSTFANGHGANKSKSEQAWQQADVPAHVQACLQDNKQRVRWVPWLVMIIAWW